MARPCPSWPYTQREVQQLECRSQGPEQLEVQQRECHGQGLVQRGVQQHECHSQGPARRGSTLNVRYSSLNVVAKALSVVVCPYNMRNSSMTVMALCQ